MSNTDSSPEAIPAPSFDPGDIPPFGLRFVQPIEARDIEKADESSGNEIEQQMELQTGNILPRKDLRNLINGLLKGSLDRSKLPASGLYGPTDASERKHLPIRGVVFHNPTELYHRWYVNEGAVTEPFQEAMRNLIRTSFRQDPEKIG